MKILFCSPCPLDPTLGAAQTLMALAEVLGTLGWECDLIDPPTLRVDKQRYPAALFDYLKEHAGQYDVVEFDYKKLAFDRQAFPRDTLFVARCQLLIHHHLNLRVPRATAGLAGLKARLLAPRNRRRMRNRIRQATATLQAADLVIVLNERDQRALGRHHIAASKIRVVPNGMTEVRHQALGTVPVAPPPAPIIGFIGMFGPRKGAADFPDIVRQVVERVPEARFRLLGTRGRYRTAEEVLACFPQALHPCVEVIPTFEAEALPDLLSSCSVGIFPSYLEGFGLGVLEMLAAAVPVVAYDVPGPPAMLPPEYLVPPGDTAAMSNVVSRLLEDSDTLARARHEARARAQAFRWQTIVPTLAATYEAALQQHRARPEPQDTLQ